MLVLTRKCQEKIQIGENITITIVRVKGQSVRIGIEAPRELKVLRTELPPQSPAVESPAGEAVADGAQAANKPAARSPAVDEDISSGSLDDQSDWQASYLPGKKPLAQYVHSTRLLSTVGVG